MKSIFVLGMFLVTSVYGQVLMPTYYDAPAAAEEIIKGNLGLYLSDTIDYTEYLGNDEEFITKYKHSVVVNKIYRLFRKGKPEYTRRTNGGYVFTIAVISNRNDLDALFYCIFYVSAYTQKIYRVEISKDK
jgi:hypothetical protein